MSLDMEKRLRALAKIGDRGPAFVVGAGSLESADKWARLIHHLAKTANENAGTGYDTYPLEDDLGLLPGTTFDVLRNMGVALPENFPAGLDLDGDDFWGFYAAYADELMTDEELELNDTDAQNINRA
jgi:hypothetical protein